MSEKANKARLIGMLVGVVVLIAAPCCGSGFRGSVGKRSGRAVATFFRPGRTRSSTIEQTSDLGTEIGGKRFRNCYPKHNWTPIS